jgi:hypothetical protein
MHRSLEDYFISSFLLQLLSRFHDMHAQMIQKKVAFFRDAYHPRINARKKEGE